MDSSKILTTNISSSQKVQFIDITNEINAFLASSDISQGVCYVYVPHTTAAITINEGHDPDVAKDILKKFSLLVPEDKNYSHAEGNSDAHIKSSLVGCSVNILIEKSELVLGAWQRICFFKCYLLESVCC